MLSPGAKRTEAGSAGKKSNKQDFFFSEAYKQKAKCKWICRGAFYYLSFLLSVSGRYLSFLVSHKGMLAALREPLKTAVTAPPSSSVMSWAGMRSFRSQRSQWSAFPYCPTAA